MGINEIRPDVIARGKNSAFEAERYELTEPPRYHFELQRREFFRVMGAGAVVLVASLWAYIFANYPNMNNEITIKFPPVGDITTLHSRDQIFKIPGTATAILAVNFVAALLFQPRERAATYLLLSGTIFLLVVFWVAAIVAVVNA